MNLTAESWESRNGSRFLGMSWSSWTYETHMTDIKALWSEIRSQLKLEAGRADEIDARLREMFAAFDAGKRDEGRKVAWAIHNSGLTRLR